MSSRHSTFFNRRARWVLLAGALVLVAIFLTLNADLSPTQIVADSETHPSPFLSKQVTLKTDGRAWTLTLRPLF